MTPSERERNAGSAPLQHPCLISYSILRLSHSLYIYLVTEAITISARVRVLSLTHSLYVYVLGVGDWMDDLWNRGARIAAAQRNGLSTSLAVLSAAAVARAAPIPWEY